MSIILLHGNGKLGLSQKLSLIKKDFDSQSIQEINSKNSSFSSARIEALTPQLFSEKRLVILEDFGDADLDQIETSETLTLVLKYSKKLAANSVVLKNALKNKAQIFLFEEAGETPIFPFLDKLGEKNPKAFEELQRNQEEWGGQYVITMMTYLLRRLVMPTKKMSSFVAQRVENQKKNFSLDEIKILYRTILESDFKIKSGLIDEKMALVMIVEKFTTRRLV